MELVLSFDSCLYLSLGTSTPSNDDDDDDDDVGQSH